MIPSQDLSRLTKWARADHEQFLLYSLLPCVLGRRRLRAGEATVGSTVAASRLSLGPHQYILR